MSSKRSMSLRACLVASLCAVSLSAFVVGCGDDAELPNPNDPALRPLLTRILSQARTDSAALALAKFDAVVSMRMELRQGSLGVRVADSLKLKRDSASGYIGEQLAHKVTGDTSLLANMYSFEDAKGNPRGSERARLASLNFGTSFPLLLQGLLDTSATTPHQYALIDSNGIVSGVRCYHIAYRTDEKRGAFWVETTSLRLIRLEVRQSSNYVVGSYDYRALIDFSYFGGKVPIPVATRTNFEYRRVFTNGSGSIGVIFDSVAMRQ